MTLYISHSAFLPFIELELAKVLGSGGKLLLFYDGQLPCTVIDYVSEEKIRIKKIQAPLEQIPILIAYELGKLLSSDKEMQVILWGGFPFPETLQQMILYDKSICSSVSVKEICEKKPAKKKVRDNKAKKTSEARVPAEAGKPPTRKPEVEDKRDIKSKNEAGRVSMTGDAAKKIKQVHPVPTRSSQDSLFEDIEDIPMEVDRPQKPQPKKTGIPHNLTEMKKENEEGKVYDKAIYSFADTLNDICGTEVEPTSASAVMLALAEAAGASNMDMAKSIYHKGLESYLSEKKSVFFWDKTERYFEQLMKYFQ